MFDFLKKEEPDTSLDIPQVLGLKLGGAIEFNELKFKLLAPQLTIENIEKTQLIQAVGVVKLDDNHFILRYYTDDDGFLQVVLDGGLTDNYITDVKLWYFYDTVGVSSDQQWENQLSNEISQEKIILDGHTFQRYWNDSSGNPPVAMTETTYSEDESESETDQFVMLYHRELENNLVEFLMVSGEELETQHQLEHCIVRSTGINVSSADFEIIA